MSWRKLLKPGPVDLGREHLNEVIEPDTYVQPFASRATRAQGYPFEGQGVHLEVLPWRPSDGGVIQRATPQNGVIVTRYWLTGTWSAWRDTTGRTVS